MSTSVLSLRFDECSAPPSGERRWLPWLALSCSTRPRPLPVGRHKVRSHGASLPLAQQNYRLCIVQRHSDSACAQALVGHRPCLSSSFLHFGSPSAPCRTTSGSLFRILPTKKRTPPSKRCGMRSGERRASVSWMDLRDDHEARLQSPSYVGTCLQL